MVFVGCPIALINTRVLLRQNHRHRDRSFSARSLLREYELTVLLDALSACGNEAILQVPGLIILNTEDVFCEITTHNQLRKVVEEVVEAHRKNAIVLVPTMHEASISGITAHAIISIQELLFDIVGPELGV